VRRAARSKWLNRFVGGPLSGYLIFQAFQPYRQSHVIYHHGHLGEEGLDPDYQLYLDAGLYDGLTRLQFALRHVLATLLLLNAPAYLWYVVKNRLVAFGRNRGELVGFVLWWTAILAVIHLAGAWRLFLLYWIVPFATAFLVIGRFIEIAEHYPMLSRHQQDGPLHSTRNRFSHPVEAMFFSMHNENYHLLHHLRPDIPFWNVARAHRVMLGCPAYAQTNSRFGGIFLSSNGQPALFPALLAGTIALPLERGRFPDADMASS
jgi:fatty acid desaturase